MGRSLGKSRFKDHIKLLSYILYVYYCKTYNLKKAVLLCFIRADVNVVKGTEGFPRGHRTHSSLTPVASYADPPSSLQTTAECPVLLSAVGSSICLAGYA